MGTKITRDVLESYLHCKFKGHLKLNGQQGSKCDYETLLTEMRSEVRLAAIDKILSRHPDEEIPRNVPLTTTLKKGASFLLDATLEDDHFSLVFDGVKKMEGASKLGGFHYIPMIFHEGRQVRKEQKLLLELYGLLISQIQGQMPVYGVVWLGKESKATRVRLNADLRKTERLLRDLKEMGRAEPPRLMLNDHCQVCEFRQRCHDQAVREDNISLLSGIGEKETKKYAGKGIFTITQLAYTFRPRRKRKKSRRNSKIRHPALQALAIRDQKTYVLGAPELPATPLRIYLDIEGVPGDGLYYLIGMLVSDGIALSYMSFWADSKAEEAAAWKSFVGTIGTFGDFRIFHYGNYEVRFFASMEKQYGISADLQKKLRANSINVLSKIYTHVYFPVYSNGLKSIGAFLGFKWSSDEASGIQSLVWRRQWEATNNRALKDRLIAYNRDDCRALRIATLALDSIANNGPDSKNCPGVVAHAEDLKPEHSCRFGRNEFFFPELERINKCAYFDYQRERIFVRTSQAVKTGLQRQARQLSKSLRINKTILCDPADKCFSCQSQNIATHSSFSRIIYDLKLLRGGIKRWVLRYVFKRYRCKRCGKVFASDSYEKLGPSKYGRALLAWCVYRAIEMRQSQGSIAHELAQLFGYSFDLNIAARLKAKASKAYESAYGRLVEKLKTGRLVHIDETKVSIRGVEGYVWVFTNLQEVVYVYRETRDGDFLFQALDGFAGILVSDFYSAYDSIDCIQQKCLIHLIRDINDDLFKHPFDEELKNLAHLFTQTLAPIIETIDKYGLKQRHLRKHQAQTRLFLNTIISSALVSAEAQNYQRRISKYRDKLFVFLEHDGVPWNNNNAEHAIKRFAFLRNVIGGTVTAKGIREYLVLLSVCETLRLRGISVLKFLMSGETDMDKFTV